jgi:hypothetical protein
VIKKLITIEGCLNDGINSLGFFKKLSLKFSFCFSFELKSSESFFEKEKIFIVLLKHFVINFIIYYQSY